jgi:hypothetical protein
MLDNEPYKKLFREQFEQLFDKAKFDELPWQDMSARCRKFRARAG